MSHWYDDAAFVRRVQINLEWVNRSWGGIVGDVRIDSKVGPQTKAAIIEAKRLLGLPKDEQVWGTGVDETFILRLHHPTGYGLTGEQAALGLRLRNEARRIEHNPTSMHDAAVFVYHNGSFWTGLSTGSERIKFQQLAERGVAWCNHRRRWCHVELRVVLFLVDCIHHTPTLINALNGGDHPYEDRTGDYRHYADPCEAVDLDLSRGSTATRMELAHHHGLHRNAERDHEHYGTR